jgi:hypothetical protein
MPTAPLFYSCSSRREDDSSAGNNGEKRVAGRKRREAASVIGKRALSIGLKFLRGADAPDRILLCRGRHRSAGSFYWARTHVGGLFGGADGDALSAGRA